MTGDLRNYKSHASIITQSIEGHVNTEEPNDSAVSLSRPEDKHIKIIKASPLPLIKRKFKDILECVNNSCVKMNARVSSTLQGGYSGYARNASKWKKTPMPYSASALDVEYEKFWKYKLNQIPSKDLPIDISSIPEVPAITYKQSPSEPEIPPRPVISNKTPKQDTKSPEIPPCIMDLKTSISPEEFPDKPETMTPSVPDSEIKLEHAEVKENTRPANNPEITGFRFRQAQHLQKSKVQQKIIYAQANWYRNSPLGLTTCSRDRIYTNLYNEPPSELPNVEFFGERRNLISRDTKKPVILETLGTSYGEFCCAKRQ